MIHTRDPELYFAVYRLTWNNENWHDPARQICATALTINLVVQTACILCARACFTLNRGRSVSTALYQLSTDSRCGQFSVNPNSFFSLLARTRKRWVASRRCCTRITWALIKFRHNCMRLVENHLEWCVLISRAPVHDDQVTSVVRLTTRTHTLSSPLRTVHRATKHCLSPQ